MSYRGRVQNGVVVFDESAVPPDGTIVRIEPIVDSDDAEQDALRNDLLDLAGAALGLPEDLAPAAGP